MQPICELIPSLFQPGVEQMGPQTAPVKPPRYKFHERSVILRCESSECSQRRMHLSRKAGRVYSLVRDKHAKSYLTE